MAESLRQKTFKGTLWSAVERFAMQGVGFVVMIIMARILTPDDYGLVGMLTIFIAVSQSLVDCGFSQALIRKRDRSETDNSTVFFFNIGVGLFLYLVLFLLAPVIGRFYEQPILVPLTRVIALSVVINSFVVVQRALLTVKIDFRTQAKASLTAALLSGIVGIGMAYTGFGVWSIVGYQLVNLGVNAGLLWIFSRWKPKRIFSKSSFKELFSFGSKLAMSGLLTTLYNNIYMLVIGKAFNAADLGYYTRAHQFANFPSSNLTGVLQRVTFPVLCAAGEDEGYLVSVYRRLLRISAFIIFPLMMGLAVVAKPLVMVLLKEQWIFAATLLTIICFQMMWFPIHAINLNLLQVKGRSDLFLRLDVIKKIIGVAILFLSLPFGLVMMCVGGVVDSLLSLVINTYYTGKLINVGLWRQMRDVAPSLCYSLSMGVVVFFSIRYIASDMLQLIVGIIVGLIYFIGAAWLTGSRDLRELLSFISRKRRRSR